MFKSVFFKKEESMLSAVFDISSYSVGGLLFENKKDHSPEIIASIRKETDFINEDNLSKLRKNLKKAVGEVAGYLKKHSSLKIRNALCVFSSPWHNSQSKLIRVQRENPFEITKELMEKLIDEESQQFERTWGKNGNVFFLEKEILKVLLNGYETNNPLNKRARKMEIYAYFSLAVNNIKEKIEKIISETLSLTPDSIHFNSTPFIFFNILDNILDIKEGALFVDVSGEITDIFVIQNGVIGEINSFPGGTNFIIRRLASAFNYNMKEARDLLNQYQRKELVEKYLSKTKIVIDQAVKEWGEHLKELLIEMGSDSYLPQNVYFCGNTAGLKEINDQFLKEKFGSLAVLGQPFQIHFLLPDSLKYHFDFKKGFSDNKDIFLLLSTIFANYSFTKNKKLNKNKNA